MCHYQTLVSATHRLIKKSSTEIQNVKYQEQHGIKSLNYLMDLILYQTFRTISNTSSRSMKH